MSECNYAKLICCVLVFLLTFTYLKLVELRSELRHYKAHAEQLETHITTECIQ